MNTKAIQRALIADRYRRNFVLPNYTPRQWWECDVFELTPAGFFREYEVKISRADFIKDATKQERSRYWRADAKGAVKHDLLRGRSRRAPNQFWFVVPKDLVTVDEVPEWAGLIYAWTVTNHYHEPSTEYAVLHEQKKAPFLHRNKIDSDIRKHAESVVYWRMHGLLLNQKPVDERLEVAA